MEEDSLAFTVLTVGVIVGLIVLIAGVLQDAEHVNALTATGSTIAVFSVMGMAGYLARL